MAYFCQNVFQWLRGWPAFEDVHTLVESCRDKYSTFCWSGFRFEDVLLVFKTHQEWHPFV